MIQAKSKPPWRCVKKEALVQEERRVKKEVPVEEGTGSESDSAGSSEHYVIARQHALAYAGKLVTYVATS